MSDIGHPATYTGTKAISYAGTMTGNGISVQGNMLTHPDEVQAIFDAAVKAQKDSLPIQDILMLALEAGARSGGDKRCGERKASSAFVSVAKPGDVEKYWLNLIVLEMTIVPMLLKHYVKNSIAGKPKRKLMSIFLD